MVAYGMAAGRDTTADLHTHTWLEGPSELEQKLRKLVIGA
jgi:hypothetical protein